MQCRPICVPNFATKLSTPKLGIVYLFICGLRKYYQLMLPEVFHPFLSQFACSVLFK